MKKTTGWQLSHEVLEHYRFRAVELWKEGKRINDISHYFGLHRVTVSYWIAKYKTGGTKALKSRKSLGPPFKLTKQEISRIFNDIKKDATEFGFETPLWTTKRLCHVIKKETGKNIHNSNVWRLLKKLGLSNKKPEKIAYECDPKEAKRWLKDEWPRIQEHAKRWRAIIYFQDETGVSLAPVMGKTWYPIGKTPTVKLTGKRGSFCVSSAISPSGKMIFRTEKGKVNSSTFLAFIKNVRKHHPNRKIIMIIDNAPPHIANKIKQYAEENKSKFYVYYLPSYSPELNPDEEVWGYLKDKKLKSHTAMTKDELKMKTFSYMRSIQRRPSLIQSFFYKIM